MAIKINVPSKTGIKVRTRIASTRIIDDEPENVNNDNTAEEHHFMYDSELKKCASIDPDKLLSKAVEDNNLPQDFINQLDNDLDNKIDLDAGLF
jgi:hypothetical protein